MKHKSFVDIYRNSTVFRELRDDTRLKGKCRVCEFKQMCDGSRARAYAVEGDYMESEPRGDNKVVDIIKDIISVLLILLMNPYGIGAMAVALLVVIIVSIYFGVEAVSLSKRFVLKMFYCPFRKKIVNVKFRPSIFTFRTFDDVIECSAFNTGKVTCKKKCLDIPEHQLNTEQKAH